MNYRLRFWHELFEGLIELHMVNGNRFDVEHGDGLGNFVKVTRMDYEADTPWPFLKYEFKFNGATVTYKVDNVPEGGTVISLVDITEVDGSKRTIGPARDLHNECIMRNVYVFTVGMLDTFWFD